MRIGGEARDRLAPDGPWLVAAAVPNHAGSIRISFPDRRAIEEWARAEHTSNDFVDGFFEPPAVVMAGVGVERYTLTTHFDQGHQASYMTRSATQTVQPLARASSVRPRSLATP